MRGDDCPMCAEGRPEELPHGLRFARGEHTDVYLGGHGPARGYAFVIWRGPHVAEPTELDPAESSAFWLEVLSAAVLIQLHFEPCKLNYELLGNGVPHLHAHIVPRYVDDVAPGRPLPSDRWIEGEANPVPDDELRRDAEALRRLAERGRLQSLTATVVLRLLPQWLHSQYHDGGLRGRPA